MIFPLSDSCDVITFLIIATTPETSPLICKPTRLSRYNDTGIHKNHLHIKHTYNLPLSREEEIIQEFILRQQERNNLENLLDT